MAVKGRGFYLALQTRELTFQFLDQELAVATRVLLQQQGGLIQHLRRKSLGTGILPLLGT
jgi:hypothetical protein